MKTLSPSRFVALLVGGDFTHTHAVFICKNASATRSALFMHARFIYGIVHQAWILFSQLKLTLSSDTIFIEKWEKKRFKYNYKSSWKMWNALSNFQTFYRHCYNNNFFYIAISNRMYVFPLAKYWFYTNMQMKISKSNFNAKNGIALILSRSSAVVLFLFFFSLYFIHDLILKLFC